MKKLMGTKTEIRIIHNCIEICYWEKRWLGYDIKRKLGIIFENMS